MKIDLFDTKWQYAHLVKFPTIQAAEIAFYNAFKSRCERASIHSAHFQDVKFFSEACHSTRVLDKIFELFSGKSANELDVFLHHFYKRIYYDLTHEYANQPIEDITIEGFKQKTATLVALSPKNPPTLIETTLRQALRAKFSSEEFLGLAAASARAEATKLSQFYTELAQDVTTDNMQERDEALHSIID